MCQRLQDGMGMDACHSCHLLELSRGGATARQTCKRTHRLAHADRSGSINSSGSCFPWMAGLQIFSSSALHCMGPMYVYVRAYSMSYCTGSRPARQLVPAGRSAGWLLPDPGASCRGRRRTPLPVRGRPAGGDGSIDVLVQPTDGARTEKDSSI